eukprot:354883-Hanusia_phi.AAC.1
MPLPGCQLDRRTADDTQVTTRRPAARRTESLPCQHRRTPRARTDRIGSDDTPVTVRRRATSWKINFHYRYTLKIPPRRGVRSDRTARKAAQHSVIGLSDRSVAGRRQPAPPGSPGPGRLRLPSLRPRRHTGVTVVKPGTVRAPSRSRVVQSQCASDRSGPPRPAAGRDCQWHSGTDQ